MQLDVFLSHVRYIVAYM